MEKEASSTKASIVEFLGALQNEDSRSFELDVTELASREAGSRKMLLEIVDGDYSEQVRYAAFYCLNIILRHAKDFEELSELIATRGEQFSSHETYSHLNSLFLIESDALYDYDAILEATYQDALRFDENAGFVHLFADVFAFIYERGGLYDEDVFVEEWYGKALDAVERAIELDSSYAKYHCTKARILCIAGKFREAETSVNKAISLERSSRSDYYLRVSTYQYYKAIIYCERRLAESKAGVARGPAMAAALDDVSGGEFDKLKPNLGDGGYAFVSYSHLDRAVVYPILQMLQEAGVHLWFDRGGITPSHEYAETIGTRIKEASCVLFMLTPNSVHSEFVRKELQMTFDCGKRPICIFLDEVDLSPGMQLQINIYEHIFRNQHGEGSFIDAIQSAVEAVEKASE